MLAGLCEAIDARPYMEGHGSRVSRLAETIALRLGWGAGRIRRHPAAGMRILARQPDFRFVIPYVLFHHEHWNGAGYPFGRRGDEIPLEARVLAVADAFDAMTSPRPYGPPLPVNEAIAEIDRCAGTQFDPLVAGVFVELCRAASPRLLAAQG